jgi:hypothetical protein
MIIRTAVVLLCACSITVSQNTKQAQPTSSRPSNTPRSAWEAARDAFMASRFHYVHRFQADTSRTSSLWDTALASSPATTAHHLSFGSTANAVELLVSGTGKPQFVTVQPENVPDWLSVSPAQQKVMVAKSTVARFALAVKYAAPVNKEAYISFLVQSAGGQQWKKDIAIFVEPPRTFDLFQNFPNPFNPTTTISFQLPLTSRISLTVYDVLGREMRILAEKEMDAGYHEVPFDASQLASGVYFYRLAAKAIASEEGISYVSTKKFMLLK